MILHFIYIYIYYYYYIFIIYYYYYILPFIYIYVYIYIYITIIIYLLYIYIYIILLPRRRPRRVRPEAGRAPPAARQTILANVCVYIYIYIYIHTCIKCPFTVCMLFRLQLFKSIFRCIQITGIVILCIFQLFVYMYLFDGQFSN